MQEIGVRELRRDASRWLARVRAGEAFVITDRGRAIARLTPLPAEGGYASLVADGRLVRGSGRSATEVLTELDGFTPPVTGLSAALAGLRADEDR